jgi:transmembrane sensor
MEETGTEQYGPVGGPPAAEDALYWFVRLRADDATYEDHARFQAWRAGQASRGVEFDKLTEIWNDLDEVGPLFEREADRAERESKSTGRRRSVVHPEFRRGYGWSAALAASLFAVIGGGWWFAGRTDIAEYRTARGEQRTVMLPDGSRLILNTETSVTTELSMLARTAVLHRGEAFFVVAHNGWKPFTVEAGNGTVRDIGTQFTVRRDPEQVTVSVVEGAVEVESASEPASKQATVLTAGEQASYGEAGGLSATTTVDVATVTAWTTGELVFEQRPLAEVVREIGRYHQGEIRVLGPRLSDRKISGRFNLRDREAFLRAVTAATQAKSSHTDKNVIILSE